MNNLITEFFQFIYEVTKEKLPEFLVAHHEFKVRHALRNLDDPATSEVLAKETKYAGLLDRLVENYTKVTDIISATPEPLQPAMLTVLGSSVSEFISEMGLEEDTQRIILGQLEDILNDYDVTIEQQQEAGALLQQMLQAQSGGTAEE